MGILRVLITIYILILFARIIFSWFGPSADQGVLGQVNHFTIRATEPALRPVRRLIPALRVGTVGVDLSAFIVMVLLGLLRALL